MVNITAFLKVLMVIASAASLYTWPPPTPVLIVHVGPKWPPRMEPPPLVPAQPTTSILFAAQILVVFCHEMV